MGAVGEGLSGHGLAALGGSGGMRGHCGRAGWSEAVLPCLAAVCPAHSRRWATKAYVPYGLTCVVNLLMVIHEWQ